MRQLKRKSVRGRVSNNYFSQPLKSGEADASPASPVPWPLGVAADETTFGGNRIGFFFVKVKII